MGQGEHQGNSNVLLEHFICVFGIADFDDFQRFALKSLKQREAYELLNGVFSWFTEGFDFPDLKEAKTLLEELR